MLPLKIYNSLPYNIRRQIVDIVFNNMTSDFKDGMCKEFHHNFNYQGGHWYKTLLSCCTYNKNTSVINVTINIPFDINKIEKHVDKPKEKPVKLKRYYFRIYQCGDEDGDNIWEEATSLEEAKRQVYMDYHSIDRLDFLYSK